MVRVAILLRAVSCGASGALLTGVVLLAGFFDGGPFRMDPGDQGYYWDEQAVTAFGECVFDAGRDFGEKVAGDDAVALEMAQGGG